MHAEKGTGASVTTGAARTAEMAGAGTPADGEANTSLMLQAPSAADASSVFQHEVPNQLPRFLLDPDSRAMGMWDLFTGITLLVVALFTPFEIAFLPSPTSFDDPLCVFGRIVDSIFISDMFLCFFISVPSQRDPSKLETRRSVIVRSYLRGWFMLDALSLASSAFDIVPIVLGSADGTKSPLTSFRVIRILRLMKLIRLLRASKRLKDWSVQFAVSRALLTIVAALSQVIYLIHLVACIFKLLTVIPDSPLETWLATYGYCTPLDGKEDDYECSSAGYIYLQTIWWSAGIILGAPISLAPNQGPFEAYYSRPQEPVKLTVMEQVFVIIFKTVSAFFFLTVTARFVTVYNNLNPDAKAFNHGMDSLNAFVNYFHLGKADGRELRRYYVERMEEVRARTRKRTMHDFSPHLAEKYVWKLNSAWLKMVPCFSMVVERMEVQPDSGMERFLVRVALEMQPATFVPTEKPPAKRLYIITDGEAMHHGRLLKKGDTWGAYDVLLNSSHLKRNERASAITYLHVFFVGASTFETIGAKHREGLMLSRLWALVHAAGTELIREYREDRRSRIKVGDGHGSRVVRPKEVQQRINRGLLSVEYMRGEDGKKQFSTDGLVLFKPKYNFIDQEDYEIVALKAQDQSALTFEVRKRLASDEDSEVAHELEEGVGAELIDKGGARNDGGILPTILSELRKLRQAQEQDSQALRALSTKVEQLAGVGRTTTNIDVADHTPACLPEKRGFGGCDELSRLQGSVA